MSMAMRTQRERPEDLRTATAEFPTSPSHPFYRQLDQLLERGKFDEFLKRSCKPHGTKSGRPRLAPASYFRLLLVGYFEAIDSSQGIAWRVADSLSLRRFLGIAPDQAPPDHLAISEAGRLIGLDTHRKVLRWVLKLQASEGLGKSRAAPSATPEDGAAMRSIVRRGNSQACEAFLKGLAAEWAEGTPERRPKRLAQEGISHPFYQRLNDLLALEKFDAFAEKECNGFARRSKSQACLAPGAYFRLLLVGYFEGIDSERGIAWRVADSLSLRQFLGLAANQPTPAHSTISETRRLIDVETHRRIFFWLLGLVADRGLVKGKRIGIDSTTLAATAAMRPIVWRDEVESYQDFLDGLAKDSGIETPTRQALVRLGRERKKKTPSPARRPRKPEPCLPVEVRCVRSADRPVAAGPFEPCSLVIPTHPVTLGQFKAYAGPVSSEPRHAPGAAAPRGHSEPLPAVPIRLPENASEPLISGVPGTRTKARGRKRKAHTLPLPAVAAARFCQASPEPVVAACSVSAPRFAVSLSPPELEARPAAASLALRPASPAASPAEPGQASLASSPIDRPRLAIRVRALDIAPALRRNPRTAGLGTRAPRETGFERPRVEIQVPRLDLPQSPLPVIQEVRKPKRWILRIPKADFRKARAVAVGFLAASLAAFGVWFGATQINVVELWSGARQQFDRAVQARAAFQFEDNFQSGLEGWDGVQHFGETWAFDKDGFMRPGKLALFQPSAGTTDYSFEFLMQIDHKGMGWVFRALDQQNYYAMKLVAANSGPRMAASLVHYAVVDGKKEAAVQTPLPMMMNSNRPYRIRVEVKGSQFITTVDGQVVNTWSDGRLLEGGVGFFTDRGEQARLYWMRLSKNLDFLGGLCAILAPHKGGAAPRLANIAR
jgi:transposase